MFELFAAAAESKQHSGGKAHIVLAILLVVVEVGKFVVDSRGLQHKGACQAKFHAAAGQKHNGVGGASDGLFPGASEPSA